MNDWGLRTKEIENQPRLKSFDTDTAGAIESVHINLVSVEWGLTIE